MPTTPRGIVYPASSDHTRLWEHLQTLASTADAAVQAVADLTVVTLATDTAVSAGFTTVETVTDSVTATLVAGQRYRVTWDGAFVSTIAGDVVLYRIREDNGAGTVLQSYRTTLSVQNIGFGAHMEAWYTAAASGSKTFVMAAVRSVGTGTVTRTASATTPSNLYVEPR